MESEESRHTCLKLDVSEDSQSSKQIIFVKGNWFPCQFSLSITDGYDAWLCNASEEDVKERASQWDQSVSEYIHFAETFLGFQHPTSVYRITDAGNGYKRLSFTFEKEGIQLEWRWRCKPSSDSKSCTASILDFLMEANIRLSEEVVKTTQSFEQLKEEAQKCLVQSEKLSTQREEFESEVYAKFVSVLNSKKAKLRELRDRLSKQEANGKLPQEEEVSTDGTEPYHSRTDDDMNSEDKSDGDGCETSKDVLPRSKNRVRKRNTLT
ncbi:DNA repair protein XRCC4 [Beta vulgaris subsp. vulgaris]|uniref:DNA repair protein XRCC4 n=1 Tax=Beta vulgaris subsp. vulgaris TaxID=3555 RepID=UPI00053F8CFB|nr:DNA repair protein XRCC4 [Beta vulgaris subsp. vulgaris]